MRLLLICLSVVFISCSSAPEPSEPGPPNPAQTYLDKAAKEPGAVRTASGLIYTELKPGAGASPKATDTVTVHYRGTLVDGTEFDSSYARNEPTQFPLNQVIPCWREGVQKMKVGGKSRLVCPSSIAYGDGGSPPVIPGGATLIFEVELLGISGA
jgi:FKBP-type peptidyl-prolyl cis-trans isomerase FkpA